MGVSPAEVLDYTPPQVKTAVATTEVTLKQGEPVPLGKPKLLVDGVGPIDWAVLAERARDWTLEPPKNPTESQARTMADHAGIVLTRGQIGWYVEHRLGIVNSKTPEEPSIPLDLSDQQLLVLALTPEQVSDFRRSYPNIFPPDGE